MTSQEARTITRYLLNTDPGEKEIRLYAQALGSLNITSNDRLPNLALRYPLLLPYLDAGLAIMEPEHPLRQRIYIMLAILETNPSHAHFFIYKQNKWWLLSLSMAGLKAVTRSAVGFCIVKLLFSNYLSKHDWRA